MSIPKEPRQLMINIMYLVLTAMLALNMSAEILNAFNIVDNGLKTSNEALDTSNASLPEMIKEGAKKKKSLQKYADRVPGVQSTAKEAEAYINELIQEINDGSKNDKDKSAATRILVDSGKGEKLKEKLLAYKAEMSKYVDENDREKFLETLPIEIDEDAYKNSIHKKKNWSDYTFGHMPKAAVMPILNKYKNDIKSSENKVLNYLAGKVGGEVEVVLEKFVVASAPKKSYLIKGEQFETDVFLSAAAGGDSNTNISISVNGRPLKKNADGVAKFTAPANSLGIKKYEAKITVIAPGQPAKTYRKTFEYEVGERSVAVSAAKMNVFYIGVDNPVEVSAAGISSNDMNVSMSGGTIRRNGNGTFNVRVNSPGKATVRVTGKGLNKTFSKEFRVRKIPNPVPMLSNKKGGVIASGAFKAQKGIIPKLENFEFDAKCNIQGFKIVRVAKRQDAQPAVNSGGRYKGKAANLVKLAKPGDTYYFQDIKAKCPGDAAARNIGGMVFNIR